MQYVLPLGNIIREQSINFHCVKDDTVKPDETICLTNLQTCLKDTTLWVTGNPAAKLKQNLKLLSGWAHNILEI